jgi:chromosome segregation ATPase
MTIDSVDMSGSTARTTGLKETVETVAALTAWQDEAREKMQHLEKELEHFKNLLALARDERRNELGKRQALAGDEEMRRELESVKVERDRLWKELGEVRRVREQLAANLEAVEQKQAFATVDNVGAKLIELAELRVRCERQADDLRGYESDANELRIQHTNLSGLVNNYRDMTAKLVTIAHYLARGA